MSNFKKRVITYCRVSTATQARRETIEYQRMIVKKLAVEHNLDVIEHIEDCGISGTSLQKREFANLLKRLDTGDLVFDVLVLSSVDRIIREDLKYRPTNDPKLDQLRKAKVRRSMRDVAEIKGILITNQIQILDQSGSFQNVSDELFSIKQTLAASELDKIKTRMVAGQLANLEKGIPHCGILPYGYKVGRNDAGRMNAVLVDYDSAKTLRLIFKLLIEIGPKKVVEYLNDNKIPTPQGRGKKKWMTGTIWLLRSKAENYYTGQFVYSCQGKQAILQFTPILPKEEYEAYVNRTWKQTRHDKKIYLTTRLAICGKCKKGMAINNPPTGHRVYCRYCHLHEYYIPVENKLWIGVCVRLFQIAFAEKQSNNTISINNQIVNTKQQLTEIETKLKNLATMMLAGLDIDLFTQMNSELQKEKLAISNTLEKLKKQKSILEKQQTQKELLEKRIKNILIEITKPVKLERKRELLASILQGNKKVRICIEETFTTIHIPAYNGFDELVYTLDENPFKKVEWSNEAMQYLKTSTLDAK